MDQINKTDQLFREKLDQVEFQPSDQAWAKVQGSISSKGTIQWSFYLKIAAGIALVLTMGLLFYPKQGNDRIAISEISDPKPLEIASLEVEEVAIEATPAKAETKVVKPEAKALQEEVKKVVEEPVQINREPLELAIIDEVNIAEEIITAEEPIINEPEDQPAVKITYFTARTIDTPTEEVEQDSVKTKLFDKMKFFAKNVSPVELLTDLRTAKEELIENGFKRN
ncbi:MAG: hypothetical protein ACFHWX_06445 [Bacteroidota bacterium]